MDCPTCDTPNIDLICQRCGYEMPVVDWKLSFAWWLPVGEVVYDIKTGGVIDESNKATRSRIL